MSVFPDSKHLCSWAGLAPQNDQSAGKKKTTRISRAGAYIKPLLVQCALAAVKSKKHSEIANRYNSLKKRRGHKKAIIAVARMLLTAIYNILKKHKRTTRNFIANLIFLRSIGMSHLKKAFFSATARISDFRLTFSQYYF